MGKGELRKQTLTPMTHGRGGRVGERGGRRRGVLRRERGRRGGREGRERGVRREGEEGRERG